MLPLVFLPLFEDVTVDDVTERYGTLFDMASTPAGAPAVIGIMLFAALLALLLVSAAVRGRFPALPVSIVAVAAVMIIMLITKPHTDNPPLSHSGLAGLVLVVCTAVLATVHAIHLAALRR
jgi:hypothetical protein